MLEPKIVGKWDANHLWVQWTPSAENAYALRVRYWRPGLAGWTPWVETHTPWPIQDVGYFKIPTHSQGSQVQVEMAIFAGTYTPGMILRWERAQAATFKHCEAEFEFLAEESKVTFAKGDIFTALVDGDVASFVLGDDIELMPGVPQRVKLAAAQATGVCQLDHPGHFSTTPKRGVRLTNTKPSENDLEFLESDTVTIESGSLTGLMTMALGAVNKPPVEQGQRRPRFVRPKAATPPEE